MDIEKLEKITDKLSGKLMRVQRSLDTIALLMLVDEFYTKDERKQLYDEYTRYCADADMLRCDFRGEEVDKNLIMDNLSAANKLVVDFQKKHGLIARLASRNKLYSDGDLND
jgi:FtsZ-binding cell division protein ZapB